jgi:hypothetical protein
VPELALSAPVRERPVCVGKLKWREPGLPMYSTIAKGIPSEGGESPGPEPQTSARQYHVRMSAGSPAANQPDGKGNIGAKGNEALGGQLGEVGDVGSQRDCGQFLPLCLHVEAVFLDAGKLPHRFAHHVYLVNSNCRRGFIRLDASNLHTRTEGGPAALCFLSFLHANRLLPEQRLGWLRGYPVKNTCISFGFWSPTVFLFRQSFLYLAFQTSKAFVHGGLAELEPGGDFPFGQPFLIVPV